MALKWERVHNGKWVNKYIGPTPSNPYISHYRQEYDDGLVLTKESQRSVVKGGFIVLTLWIVIAWAYIFITHYAWTTAAVVTGVVVALSLITMGIRRTAVGIFRFIWWVILMAVMTDVVVRVGGSFTDNMHGVLLPFLAVVLIFAVWLYSTVKITRLVF